MASPIHPARSAPRSRRNRSVGYAVTGLLSCSILAGCAWGLASTFGAMHGATRSLSEARINLATPLLRGPAARVESQSDRNVKVAKFSRLGKPTESEIEQRQRRVAAIKQAEQRKAAVQLAFAEAAKNAETTTIQTASALTLRQEAFEERKTDTPVLVTALVEDVAPRDMAPFGLVLAKPDGEEDEDDGADDMLALPGDVPLPATRPDIEPEVTEKPPVEKEPKKALSEKKPDRSLFGSLFGKKSNETGWPGKGTKVAIYDVSNATVYMPDGTKLRAHSGIGAMRDNPRYEHVKMKGPTPAGIYRLSMREKRFYGVEAIRMTSIDGRDPKNRTGLLTHTNLLRGQIGSHGCVAFQKYEPFLKAFKRGQVTTLMVVPELPSSRTRLAALYRKAGA